MSFKAASSLRATTGLRKEGTRRHPRVGVFLSNCASTRPSCSQWRSEWQPMDSSLARLGLLEREERGRRVGNGMQPLFRLSRGRARRLCKCCSRRRNRCHSGLFSPPSLSWYAHTLIPITSPATTILRGILFRSSRTKFLTNSGKQGEGERERALSPLGWRPTRVRIERETIEPTPTLLLP